MVCAPTQEYSTADMESERLGFTAPKHRCIEVRRTTSCTGGLQRPYVVQVEPAAAAGTRCGPGLVVRLSSQGRL